MFFSEAEKKKLIPKTIKKAFWIFSYFTDFTPRTKEICLQNVILSEEKIQRKNELFWNKLVDFLLT